MGGGSANDMAAAFPNGLSLFNSHLTRVKVESYKVGTNEIGLFAVLVFE